MFPDEPAFLPLFRKSSAFLLINLPMPRSGTGILPASWHPQLTWPFGWWVSLDAVREDPDIRLEVLLATAAIVAAALLLAIALRGRRRRLPAFAVLAATLWAGAPHVRPVLIPAGPTIFYRSPTDFAAVSIADGARLFPTHCATCHGANGQGDGPAAMGLPVPPADLTAAHLWMHSDGELFGWLSNGIEAPGGGLVMPGFAAVLTPDQRWHLIDYIRGHNAGLAYQAKGAFPRPITAPDLTLRCGPSSSTLRDLRGVYARVVITPTGIDVLPDGAAVCTGADGAARTAYATLAATPAGSLAGMQFLIDDQGRLRAIARPPAWDDPAQLRAAIADLRAHPPQDMTQADMDMEMDMPKSNAAPRICSPKTTSASAAASTH